MDPSASGGGLGPTGRGCRAWRWPAIVVVRCEVRKCHHWVYCGGKERLNSLMESQLLLLLLTRGMEAKRQDNGDLQYVLSSSLCEVLAPSYQQKDIKRPFSIDPFQVGVVGLRHFVHTHTKNTHNNKIIVIPPLLEEGGCGEEVLLGTGGVGEGASHFFVFLILM